MCAWNASTGAGDGNGHTEKQKVSLMFLDTMIGSGDGSDGDNGGVDDNEDDGNGGVADEADQAGWPPWEKEEYRRAQERQRQGQPARGAQRHVDGMSASQVDNDDPASASRVVASRLPPPPPAVWAWVARVSLQVLLCSVVLGMFVFAAPQRTGGVSGVLSTGGAVLPAFFCGMVAERLRRYLFLGTAAAAAAQSAYKVKTN